MGVAAVSVFLTAAATAMNMEQQAQAAKRQESYAKKQAKYAKEQGEHNAEILLAENKREQDQLQDARQRKISQINVHSAKSGLSSGSGSALEILAGEAARSVRDIYTLAAQGQYESDMARHNGAVKEASYKNKAAEARYKRKSSGLHSGLSVTKSLLKLGNKM